VRISSNGSLKRARGFGETHFATNNMILGAVVVILGIGSVFYEMSRKERFEKEPLVPMEHAKERV